MFYSLSTKAVKLTSILCYQKPAMEDKNSLLSLFVFFIVTQTPNHGNWDKAISFKKRSLFKEPEINRQKGSQWWLHSISNFLFVRTELSGGIIVIWAHCNDELFQAFGHHTRSEWRYCHGSQLSLSQKVRFRSGFAVLTLQIFTLLLSSLWHVINHFSPHPNNLLLPFYYLKVLWN